MDAGAAHHKFLEQVCLEKVGSADELKTQAQRLSEKGVLSSEECALLDFEGLAAFWQSALGQKVRAQSEYVQRELAFTARFSPAQLAALTAQQAEPNLEGEFVVVQGVVDLAIILPKEICIIDFKTDRVSTDQLAARAKEYEPQLKLYAHALAQIYSRPVSDCWLYFLDQRKAVAISQTSPAGVGKPKSGKSNPHSEQLLLLIPR